MTVAAALRSVVVVQVHVDVDVLVALLRPEARVMPEPVAHAGAMPAAEAVATTAATAAVAPGHRVGLVPAELAGDRLEARQRRREVLCRDGSGDALAERTHLDFEAVAGLTAGVGEHGRGARDPPALGEVVQGVGLGVEPLGESLVASLTREEVEHPPVAAGDAVGGEEFLHLVGEAAVDDLQPEAEGPVGAGSGPSVPVDASARSPSERSG